MVQKVWKLTKTQSRQNAIQILSELLKTSNFSKLMDTLFVLARNRLKKKDEIRRIVQKYITEFSLIPEDFVWSKQ